jgi:hypothetical protein
MTDSLRALLGNSPAEVNVAVNKLASVGSDIQQNEGAGFADHLQKASSAADEEPAGGGPSAQSASAAGRAVDAAQENRAEQEHSTESMPPSPTGSGPERREGIAGAPGAELFFYRWPPVQGDGVAYELQLEGGKALPESGQPLPSAEPRYPGEMAGQAAVSNPALIDSEIVAQVNDDIAELLDDPALAFIEGLQPEPVNDVVELAGVPLAPQLDGAQAGFARTAAGVAGQGDSNPSTGTADLSADERLGPWLEAERGQRLALGGDSPPRTEQQDLARFDEPGQLRFAREGSLRDDMAQLDGRQRAGRLDNALQFERAVADGEASLGARLGRDGLPAAASGLPAGAALTAADLPGSSLGSALSNWRSEFAGQLQSELTATSTAGQLPSVRVTGSVLQQGWADSLSRSLSLMVARNMEGAQLEIDPPELGPLQVRLQINNDQVALQFSSQHASVREALEQSVARLQDMLGEEGLDLVNVDVSDQREGASDDRRAGSAFAEQAGSPDEELAADEQASLLMRSRLNAHRGQVDTFI